ncbi:MAG: long-chain fatty acid--CoA ligase [Acidobacteriia bacterium]|nr:long-chain fatty acid--CoA ligase [Terriglobia bacterium]
MSAYSLLRSGHDPQSRVCFDAGLNTWLTRAELISRTDDFAADLTTHLRSERKALGFAFLRNDLPSVTVHLGIMEAGHAIAALDAELDADFRRQLIARFHPDFILVPVDDIPGWSPGEGWTGPVMLRAGMVLWCSTSRPQREIHPDLALLFSTSGSTGSPRFVRLSARNLALHTPMLNAALASSPADVAILTSPVFNALGQSLIHGALLSGGSFVLTRARITSAEFWNIVRTCGCTRIAGTPYFYQVLDRLDLESLNVPTLQTFICTGGRLPELLATKLHGRLTARGSTFHIMYGQAETTARMSGIPPALLPAAIRSVGFALPPGRLWVEADGRVCGPHEEDELMYEGPGVMMGYANSSDDLAAGDLLGGTIATGDLGYRDEAGLIYITGRKSRFVKVFGWRVSLDDVEEILACESHHIAALNDTERIVVFHLHSDPTLVERIHEAAVRLRLHPSCFTLFPVDSLPLLPTGKINYRALADLLQS